MKKIFLMVLFVFLSTILISDDNVNVSFSISPPPIGIVDKYYEDISNTQNSKSIGFSYLNISSDILSINNISIDFSENHIKSDIGILYSNYSVFGGLGEIKILDDKMGLFTFGGIGGFNFQMKLYYSKNLKIFFAPGLDASMSMMSYKIKNYPVINYDTWPWSISYKEVDCNSYMWSVLPKLSFQINYKATEQLEVIPFVTISSNLTFVSVYIEDNNSTADFSYTSINFGLEAIFFEIYQLSSMVSLLNDESKTRVINISFSFAL